VCVCVCVCVYGELQNIYIDHSISLSFFLLAHKIFIKHFIPKQQISMSIPKSSSSQSLVLSVNICSHATIQLRKEFYKGERRTDAASVVKARGHLSSSKKTAVSKEEAA